MIVLQPSVTQHLRKLAATNGRSFAAAAAASKGQSQGQSAVFDERAHLIPSEDLKISKVGDVTIASVETNKPLSNLAIYIRAGSRFETETTQGVSQMLRICAGLGTQNASQFGTTRSLEKNGASLTATSGREFVAYTVQTGRNNIQEVDRYIRELTSYQMFKPWEVKDNEARLRLERKIRPPEARIIELIHKAAYRKGLGYSLYSPKWMIGNHTSEMLNGFVKNNFVEACLVATGMNHNYLQQFAETLKLSGGSRTVTPAKYHGGSEVRKETGADMAYVALAIEGASFSDHKSFTAAALLQRVLGSGPRVKRGLNLGGKLAAARPDPSKKATVTAFNTNYSDSGLVGVYISATPCSIEGAVKKSADILLSGGVSDADLVRAKNQLKTEIAGTIDSDCGLLQEIGLQVLLTGSYSGPEEINAIIDSVTVNDVNALASKGKLTMASFGKIGNVPYLDQLQKK